jgi:protein-disulfide isomerase
MGPNDALVTLVEFSDFLCPHCRLLAADLSVIRSRYGRDFAVVFRHYPMRRLSRQAAFAALCAERMHRFKSMHDALFANADSIGKTTWIWFAQRAEIVDTSAFAQCMASEDIAGALEVDSIAAARLDVWATPTVLINNMMFMGNLGLERLNLHVQRALGEAKRGERPRLRLQ